MMTGTLGGDKIVEREAHVHGSRWGSLYDGYFGDKLIAKNYVAAIMRVAAECNPSVIVDLGGGTGFILEQLIEAGIADDMRLINLDESAAQLAACEKKRITPRNGGLQSLRRADIVNESESLMLICRSVLQYGGVLGQKPWLKHLRGEMKEGEWFVHQSGCSDDIEAALALNVLFEMAGVDKWVPHREAFTRLLREEKFEIAEEFHMPPLKMPSDGIAARYGVSPENMAKIKADLQKTCSNRPDMFQLTPEGFTFNFPYRVFACKAI